MCICIVYETFFILIIFIRILLIEFSFIGILYMVYEILFIVVLFIRILIMVYEINITLIEKS